MYLVWSLRNVTTNIGEIFTFATLTHAPYPDPDPSPHGKYVEWCLYMPVLGVGMVWLTCHGLIGGLEDGLTTAPVLITVGCAAASAALGGAAWELGARRFLVV